MAAVHFTTIPCEPTRAISTHRKPYFGVWLVFKPFLCAFMSGFRIYVRYELWVNVPVAIFFGTVDLTMCLARLSSRVGTGLTGYKVKITSQNFL